MHPLGRLVLPLLLAPSLVGCLAAPEGLAPAALPALSGTSVATLVGPLRFVNEAPHAVNPNDPDHWVVVEYSNVPWTIGPERFASRFPGPSGWFATHVTRDGGATWTRHLLPGGPFGDPAHPLARQTHLRYPAVLVADDGTVLVAGMTWNLVRAAGVEATTHPEVFVARSFDGGATFPDVRFVEGGQRPQGALVLGPAGASLRTDHLTGSMPRLAGGPNGEVVLVLWHATASAPRAFAQGAGAPASDAASHVAIRVSRDAGATWTPNEYVHTMEKPISIPIPAMGSDGTLHVVYAERQKVGTEEAPFFVFHARRAPDAAEWTTRHIATSGYYADFRIERRAAGDRLLVAYSHAIDEAEHLVRTMLLESADGGAAWREPILVDAPPFRGESFPLAAPDGAGGAIVTAYSPSDAGGAMSYRAWRVADGVVSAPVELGVVNASGRTRNLGHYMGLAPHPAGAAAAWVDGYAVTAAHANNTLRLRAALVPADFG